MMTMRNRVWPLCLAAFLFLAAVQAAFFPLGAAAETAPVAEATPLPADAESASPYRIVLTAPGGWSSGNSAVMKVSVTDINHIGWQKIEYRMNESAWIDCESQFADGKAELALHKNGTFTLRVTDPQDHAFEESAQVACIDLTAPVLSASINGTSLEVFVEDDLSGVAGVQVNSMLFTTLTNGALHVELDENMNRFEKLAVRAFDYAGNFSEPVSLDNPHYTRPADPTPMPTATPEPTAKPTGEKETASPVPTATPVSSANRYNGLGSSLIYVQDDSSPTPEPTAAPTPETIIKTEYITIGPGMPYQADGNSHTLDVLYSAATNKQFITLQTKNGNTFYLVIDYDKPVDEEAEMYETYFLNLVDERDLLALMSDEEKEEVPTPTPEIIYVTPEPTAVPAITPQPSQDAQDSSGKTTAWIALAALVGMGLAGGVLLVRSKKQSAARRTDNDFDLDEDDEDEHAQQE